MFSIFLLLNIYWLPITQKVNAQDTRGAKVKNSPFNYVIFKENLGGKR
jgi:hypothetical protein